MRLENTGEPGFTVDRPARSIRPILPAAWIPLELGLGAISSVPAGSCAARQAAIDAEFRSGHVARRVGGEEQYAIGDVLPLRPGQAVSRPLLSRADRAACRAQRSPVSFSRSVYRRRSRSRPSAAPAHQSSL